MKINIHLVAEKAGVSPATVSRVINNNYPVSEETRKRVESVIKSLNYNPNALARGLVSKKTNSVGVLVPNISNLFFPSVVMALETVLSNKGYSIYLCNTNHNCKDEIKYIQQFVSRQVDGLIIVDPSKELMLKGFLEELDPKKPLVCINGYNEHINLNFVLSDQQNGAYEAIRHLLDMGHKRIGFIRGHKSYSYDIKENVYYELIKQYKLDFAEIINIGDGNNHDNIDSMAEILKEFITTTSPTALFSCNDLMAIAAINACKWLNKSVPNDISIIGFDNIIISSVVEPKLTTVDINMSELGKTAALMLLELMEGRSAVQKRVILGSRLIIRDSCKTFIE